MYFITAMATNTESTTVTTAAAVSHDDLTWPPRGRATARRPAALWCFRTFELDGFGALGLRSDIDAPPFLLSRVEISGSTPPGSGPGDGVAATDQGQLSSLNGFLRPRLKNYYLGT
jgi:hypothetical protein